MQQPMTGGDEPMTPPATEGGEGMPTEGGSDQPQQ